MEKNNWYVITGASCSGKTTIVSELEKKGYHVVHETARLLIEQEMEKGLTIQQVRKDELDFQKKVLLMKIEVEKNLNKEKLVFLDRAIPDTRAYDTLYGISQNELLDDVLGECQYKKVFILEQLEYAEDEVRIETKEQQYNLHRLLEEAYQKLNFEITKVPALPIEERVQFILENL